MYKTYYYLNRLILELQSLLIGKTISCCFSQEKDTLMIQTNSDQLWIEISVNHSEPFLNIRNRFARARKNTVEFFKELNRAEIENIQIAIDDRVIRFRTDKGSIYFAIRGKYTNIFFENKESFNSFKIEDDKILFNTKNEFFNKEFIDRFNIIDIEKIRDKDISFLRNEFKFIGKEIETEVKLRSSEVPGKQKEDYKILADVLLDIKTGVPEICLNEKTNEIEFSFSPLKLFRGYIKIQYDDLVTGFNQFFIKKHQLKHKQLKLKQISLHLEREQKRLSNKLNDLSTIIKSGSNEEIYNKYANLILINLNNKIINAGQIEVEDIYDTVNPTQRIKISLDEKLSLQKNANIYFEKARDSRIRFEKSVILYKSSQIRFDELIKLKNEIVSPAVSYERTLEIMKELKIKDGDETTTHDNLNIKFKHYLLEQKYHVYVGKDSANNDLLTTKFARQNDLWFHARSVSGSHVVLRVENNREIIPKNILKKAASLAAFHSKAKTAGVVPVAYTFKKYVVKRKGMPAGQVALLKEDVLLVKPEIPIDTEYLTE